MKTTSLKFLPLLGMSLWMFAQEMPRRGLLERRYREGEMLVYQMKATNEGRPYQAQATGVIKKDATGYWIEEFAWSNMVFNGSPFALPRASVDFRQVLSLDLRKTPAVPSLALVHSNLIGPITDLLTFYADLWLAEQVGTLNKPGDHAYKEHGAAASWADGSYVVLGEDSIDFDMTLTQVDTDRGVATLLIRHVPPKNPQVKLPAAWMREPVADTPNNWVNVTQNAGKFVAEVGKETFDVQLTVSLMDGKIVSGTIENPVKAQVRDCQDVALINCGAPRPHQILRQIEISLVH